MAQPSEIVLRGEQTKKGIEGSLTTPFSKSTILQKETLLTLIISAFIWIKLETIKYI